MKAAGGRADKAGKTAADFPADKVEAGARVEAEHTPDKELQQDIATDHLAEDKDYYAKLKRMESGACDAKKSGANIPETEGSAPKKEAQNPPATKQKSLEKGAPVGRQSEHSGFKQFTPTAFAKDRSEKKGAPKPQKAAPVPATPKAAPAPEVKEEAVKPAEAEEQQQGGGEEAEQKCMFSKKSYEGLSAMEQYLAKALPKAGAAVSDEKREAPEAGETEPKEVEAEESKGEETEEKCMAAKKSLTGLGDLSEFLEKSYGGQTVLDADMYKGVYESEGDDDDEDDDEDDDGGVRKSEDEEAASGVLPLDAEAKVRKFLADNPNPPDSKFHEFAEELGVDPAKLEAVAYKIATSAVKKSGLQGLDAMEDYLAKGVGGYKYIKREGGPGNYRYTYADTGKGKPTRGAAPQEELLAKITPKLEGGAAKPAEGAEWHAAQRAEHREAGDAAHKQWKELSGKTDTVSQLGAQFAAKKAQYHHAMESHHMAMQFHHESGAEGGKFYAVEHKKYADEHKAAADKHLADMKSHQALYDAEKEGPQKEKPAEKPAERPAAPKKDDFGGLFGPLPVAAPPSTVPVDVIHQHLVAADSHASHDRWEEAAKHVESARALAWQHKDAAAKASPDLYNNIQKLHVAVGAKDYGLTNKHATAALYGTTAWRAEKPEAEKPAEAAPKAPKGAGKGTIKVARSDMPEGQEISVKHRVGQYAVHRGVGAPGAEKEWGLTHAPSGLTVKRFAKLSDAKAMAEHLHKEAPTAFSNAKFGKGPTDPEMSPEDIDKARVETKKIRDAMESFKAVPKEAKTVVAAGEAKPGTPEEHLKAMRHSAAAGQAAAKQGAHEDAAKHFAEAAGSAGRGMAGMDVASKYQVLANKHEAMKKPSTPEEHQTAIAKQTLKMPDAMAGVMGGPSKAEAAVHLAGKGKAFPHMTKTELKTKDPSLFASAKKLFAAHENDPKKTIVYSPKDNAISALDPGEFAVKQAYTPAGELYVIKDGETGAEGAKKDLRWKRPKEGGPYVHGSAKTTHGRYNTNRDATGHVTYLSYLANDNPQLHHLGEFSSPSLAEEAAKKHHEYVTSQASKGKASDAEHLAAMKELGVKWSPGKSMPTYPGTMTQAQRDEADKHYDAISEEFSAYYAKKSMNGLNALKEFAMQKAMDEGEGTVAKDLPGGESKIEQGHGTTSPNGEAVDGEGYKASGVHKPNPGAGQDANGQLTGVDKPDDEILSDDERTSKLVDSVAAKSLDGIRNMRLPGNQREAMARENAIARQRLQKSEPDVRVGMPHPLSNQQMHGGTDARTAELVKSDGFYTGGSPTRAAPANMMSTGVLCKSCGCSHSAMLTSCPDCGDGAVRHQTMPGMPVGQTLRPVHRDADVYLPGPSPVVTRR